MRFAHLAALESFRLGSSENRTTPIIVDRRARVRFVQCFLWALFLMSPTTAWSSPLVGQVDDFQDGTLQNWTNGSKPDPINTAGGPGGTSDRFLLISSGTFGGGPKLVGFNDTQWIGDFVATGNVITGVAMDLKNSTSSTESIRIALRAAAGGSGTAGYASTTPITVPADNAWHHAVFSLTAGSLTAINSPSALSTFLTSVGDFRILESAQPALIGDTGNFQIGVDNISALPEPSTMMLAGGALGGLILLAFRRRRALQTR